MTLGLVIEGAKCWDTWWHHAQVGCDISLAQVTGVYSIASCVVLGKHCTGKSAVASWAIGLLSSISRTGN